MLPRRCDEIAKDVRALQQSDCRGISPQRGSGLPHLFKAMIDAGKFNLTGVPAALHQCTTGQASMHASMHVCDSTVVQARQAGIHGPARRPLILRWRVGCWGRGASTTMVISSFPGKHSLFSLPSSAAVQNQGPTTCLSALHNRADLNLSETLKSIILGCTIMDEDGSQGLLKTWLGFFARKRPERSAKPASLRSRKRDAWIRTDAYLQHDTDEFGEIDPEHLARTLRAFEDYVQYDSDRKSDSVNAPDVR